MSGRSAEVALAVLAFGAIIAGGFQPFYLTISWRIVMRWACI